MDLSNKIVVVTGAGRGIGRQIAISLAQSGANVAICDLSLENISRVVDEIKDIGRETIGVVCDVTDESQVAQFIEQTINNFGRIDLLVNNAGWQFVATVENSSLKDWEKTMAVNLRGPFLMCKEVIPHMKRQRKGVIINVTSRAGRVPKAMAAAYGASKFGLNGFSLCLSLEVKQYGIRVIALAPPRTNTPLAQEIMGQFDPKADLSEWPDGSQFGKTIALLADDNADQLDGVIIETGGLRP